MHGAVHSSTTGVTTIIPRRDQAGCKRGKPRRGCRETDRTQRPGAAAPSRGQVVGAALSLLESTAVGRTPPSQQTPAKCLLWTWAPKAMTGKVPTHTELALGRDRQTTKQFQTLTGSGSCARGLVGALDQVVREGHGSLATANGLGSVHKEFSSATGCL